MDNLKEKTAGGLLWGALNSGSMQILNALIGFVLARLLDPADYGIVGMLTIFYRHCRQPARQRFCLGFWST